MLSCNFEVSSYRCDTESKICYGLRGHCSYVSLLIARGAADDLNMHRGFLGPKLLQSICSLAKQYFFFEIRLTNIRSSCVITNTITKNLTKLHLQPTHETISEIVRWRHHRSHTWGIDIVLTGAYLCFPVPMFPGTDVPRTYVPRCLCSPVPMFPGTDVPWLLYFNSGH